MKDLIRIRSLISAEVEALLNQQVKKEAYVFIYIFINGIMV
jgi:ferritin